MESGVYVLAGKSPVESDLPRAGDFQAGGAGPLFTRASSDAVELLFEGVLTKGRRDTRSDAEVALEAYEREGIAGLDPLEGFYRLVVVDARSRSALVVSDPLVTRPSYLYRAPGIACVAPSPWYFRELGLEMHLDRQGLYQTFRFHHPIGSRSLVSQIIRCRPLTVYEIRPDGEVRERPRSQVYKDVDDSIDLDSAAKRIKEVMQQILEGVLSHPLLRGRSIQLPLTAGMDSRHILGELIEQRRPPALLWHVIIKPGDYEPVRNMAADLSIPLKAPPIGSLDFRSLTRKWVRRTAGFTNFHQLYLMTVAEDLPAGGVIGFDGYLLDHFLGCNRRPGMPAQRHFTPFGSRLLFWDHASLSRRCESEIREEFDRFQGPEDFRVRMFDAFNRGVYYTGGIFPVLGDQALFFAPGAHRRSFEFCRSVPEAVAAFKRARLQMFRDYFPRLAAFPQENGPPLSETEVIPYKKSTLADALAFAKGMLTLHRYDPAGGSCHEWLRTIPFFKRLHQRLVRDSALVRDRHLRPRAASLLWNLHRAGASQGHTLMSLTSAEVAYRALVKGESPESVSDWLTG